MFQELIIEKLIFIFVYDTVIYSIASLPRMLLTIVHIQYQACKLMNYLIHNINRGLYVSFLENYKLKGLDFFC